MKSDESQMTAQKKIIFMFGVSLSMLLLFVVFFLYLGKIRHTNLQKEEYENKAFAAEIALKQNDEYLKKFAEDYSLWDELASFAQQYKQEWAEDNLNTLLLTTKIKYLWVYDSNRNLTYNLTAKNFDTIKHPLPQIEFDNVIDSRENGNPRYCHFFIKHGNSILEVAGAAIHQSNDPERKSKAKGFLFMASYLDSARLKALEAVTNCKVTIVLNKEILKAGDFETLIVKDLKSWDGKAAARITFLSKDKLGMAEDKYNRLSLLVYILVIILVVMFAYIMINKNVTQPLSKIVKSLDKEDSEQIKEMMNTQDEFGLIAELINKFFDQKKLIDSQLLQISEQNKQLEALNTTKDKFFSIIAHDLRNPFGVILSTTEFLSNPNYELTKEEILDFTHDINTTARNLFNLLENLLTWARTQKGTIEYNPEFVNISDLCNEVRALLSSQAENKSINLSCEMPDNTISFADKNMTMTVVRNLTSNSLKFTQQEGKVTIKVCDSDKNFIKICVQDTGTGMNEKTLSKLFKIDEHVTTPGTADEKGTGLGLILCKEFVEKQGGIIGVESVLGEGSTFWFTLPKKGNLLKVI